MQNHHHATPFARRIRRAFRFLLAGGSLLLGVMASGMIAYPYVTDLQQAHIQQHLEHRLASPEIHRAYTRHEIKEGDSLTRISIPAIGVRTVVVEGTGPSALRAGAGHYPGTPLPGQEGNVAVAGHRTTCGKPFADLDRLHPGDEIPFETPVGQHTYRVSRDPYVVGNADWSPIAQGPGRTLTLSTCHPKTSDRQRLIVKAELET